jgi:hypothetical protein
MRAPAALADELDEAGGRNNAEAKPGG